MFWLKRTSQKITPLQTEKSQKQPKDMFKALGTFMLISKILMVAPYTIRGTPGSRTFRTVHNLDIVYYLRCLAVICVSCYGLTFYMQIAIRLKVIQAFLNVISITIIIPLIFINRGNYIKLFERFDELEKVLWNYAFWCFIAETRRVGIVDCSFCSVCA